MRLRNESVPMVERETTIDAPPEEVWEALTEEDRLEEWMAPEVELQPEEGGEIVVRDGEDQRIGTVETIEECERFAFTWTRPGEEGSLVEFAIEAVPAGTRVTVVETPIGPAASAPWGSRLARLQRH